MGGVRLINFPSSFESLFSYYPIYEQVETV
jgi:hypothetical protein